MNKEKYKVSEYCRDIRTKTGLSVYAFARENYVSNTYVREVESGKKDAGLTTTTLRKLTSVYKLTKTDLLQLDTTIQYPSSPQKEHLLKRQITNFIDLVLKPKGFTAVNIRLLENNGKRNYSLSVDSDMHLNPIFDAFGFDKQGKEVFIYILESATREISNEKYALQIVEQMIDVIASYEYSAIKVKITLIFLTSSIRAYEFANNFANSYLRRERIDIKVEYYDNRRGPKQTN